jgi:copper(I)-binding protein
LKRWQDNRTVTRILHPTILLFLLALVACGGSGELQVGDVWVRPVSEGMQNSAFYMTIENQTGEEETLLEVQTDACRVTEMHESQLTEENVMQMAPVPGGRIVIAAGETVTLEPGGLHVMCLDAESLQEGEEVPLTLVFEHAGEISVTAAVANAAP